MLLGTITLAQSIMVSRLAQPDLFVAYHATFDRDLQISGFSSGDMVDSRTNTIVWRGSASKDIDTKADPSKRERNIAKAAERLFKNYPPVK
jgi:hypothetical protein